MACARRILVWWDRDIDSSGRAIRSDVRRAGMEVWDDACRQTMAVVADHGPAADLMEKAVAQVSRYLDQVGAPLTTRKHGLVMIAFRRGLGRYRANWARLQLVGGCSELSTYATGQSCTTQADTRLDLETLTRRLSPRNAEILMLRAAGFEWKEIAGCFREPVAMVRNRFWREIHRLVKLRSVA